MHIMYTFYLYKIMEAILNLKRWYKLSIVYKYPYSKKRDIKTKK